MQKDSLVFDLIKKELERQRTGIEIRRAYSARYPTYLRCWHRPGASEIIRRHW